MISILISCKALMKIGIALPQIGEQATRENVIRLSRKAEEEDIDSLWVNDRIIWPLNPLVPSPVTPDGRLPIQFQNVFDPIELLTFVAANTKKISLGSAIVNMLFHNPVVLARRFATLDLLSEGRVIAAGFGLGTVKEEYQLSNIPFESRGKRANEFLQVLKKIWTDDIVDFKGKFYTIPASKIGPKPVQKPHIPIYYGGDSPKIFSRVVNYTDGWIFGIVPTIPNPFECLRNGMKQLKEEARRLNKDPDKLKTIVVVFPHISLPYSSDHYINQNEQKRIPFVGTVNEVGRNIQEIRDMGIEHVILYYNFSPEGRDMNKIIDITKQLGEFAS